MALLPEMIPPLNGHNAHETTITASFRDDEGYVTTRSLTALSGEIAAEDISQWLAEKRAEIGEPLVLGLLTKTTCSTVVILPP